MYSSLKEATALLKRDKWVKPYLGRYRKILALAPCSRLLHGSFRRRTYVHFRMAHCRLCRNALFGSDAGHTFALRAGIRRGKTHSALLRTLSEPQLGAAIHFKSSQAALPIL